MTLPWLLWMNISFSSSNHIACRSHLVTLVAHGLILIGSIWSIHMVVSSIWMNVLSLCSSSMMHLSYTNILRRNLTLVSLCISIPLIVTWCICITVWVHLPSSLLHHLLLLRRHRSFLWARSLTRLSRFSLLLLCLVASFL